jgi:hypothetical protein
MAVQQMVLDLFHLCAEIEAAICQTTHQFGAVLKSAGI